MATSNRTFTGSYTDKDRFKRDELHHELKHETTPAPKKKFFSRSMSHQETKIYHKVPYDKKEEAKKEGMSWDSNVKKWYHNNSVSSNASKFQKEEVEYNDMEESFSKHIKPKESSERETDMVNRKGKIKEDTEFDVVTEIKNIAAKYKEKAEKQVKELKPWTKKGEYKDLAKNIIKKREAGIAKADERLKNEEVELVDQDQQADVPVDNMALYINAIDKNLNFTK